MEYLPSENWGGCWDVKRDAGWDLEAQRERSGFRYGIRWVGGGMRLAWMMRTDSSKAAKEHG